MAIFQKLRVIYKKIITQFDRIFLQNREYKFQYLKRLQKRKKIKEKKSCGLSYSPSFLRPNMKTIPITAAMGRATVGNSGTDTLTDSAE